MLSRLVIKVGTNVLTRPDGRLDVTNISRLVDEIVELKSKGVQLILISSGAVGAGRELFPAADRLHEVARRQMLSAIGQVRLMEMYRQLFAGHELLCAQVLATKSDFRDEQHRTNMLNCFQALLHDQIVPVVNENDVVAVSELMFTDNDELAGLVAQMLKADALVILSSVDGLLDGPPEAPSSKVISRVSANDKEALSFITVSKSSFGRGGMDTKLRMAQETAQAGIKVYLGHGRKPGLITGLLDGNWEGTIIE